MKFILLGANVAILVLLGVYFLNLFAIQQYGIMTLAFLLAATLIVLLLFQEMKETLKLENPLVYVAPAVLGISVSMLNPHPVMLVLGWALAIPALVMLMQKTIQK